MRNYTTIFNDTSFADARANAHFRPRTACVRGFVSLQNILLCVRRVKEKKIQFAQAVIGQCDILDFYSHRTSIGA